MAQTRKILFLTGTRADFGKLKSLMLALHADRNFELHVFVTGMHMLAKYGYPTAQEPRPKCGGLLARVPRRTKPSGDF
jgi:UDP-N-acetylglucosamine 2-epimerase (hydrolysing)